MMRGFGLWACALLFAGNVSAQAGSAWFAPRLERQMEMAWTATWNRFYHAKTNLFYDFITSYDRGKGLSHLPVQAEISIQWPNYQGYGTGMEDCMISAGVLLDLAIDKYVVTRDKRLVKSAAKMVEGIWECSTVHGVPGYLARGVSPYAPHHVYINSSRDQYTHVVHGLWKYYNSELIDARGKERVTTLLTAYADRMMLNVTKENGFDALRANNTPDTRGISKMWEVMGHEAARLPMIYAAAWKVSGDSRYLNELDRYLVQAIDQSYTVAPNVPTYCLLQVQNSMEVLDDIVEDGAIRSKIAEIMVMVAGLAQQRMRNAMAKSKELDLHVLVSDWRTGEGIGNGTLSRTVWYNTREIGEAALSQLMARGQAMAVDDVDRFIDVLGGLDFDRLSSNGIFYLQGAYWKARRYADDTSGR